MLHNKLILEGFAAFLATLFHVCCSLNVRVLPHDMKVKAIPYNCTHHSSCGNISSITYPFRLKGDPPNCGDPNYEFSCENNQTILRTFNSDQYLVKAINYNHYTIRIADVGVHDGNCSSRPISSFSSFYTMAYGPREGCVYSLYDVPITYGLVYVSCETPMKSPTYVDRSHCIIENKYNNNGRRYHYVVVGDITYVELNVSCAIDFVTRTTIAPKRNFSYLDIHKKLVYGVELSWHDIGCATCKGEGFCRFENTTIIQSCARRALCTRFTSNCDFHCKLEELFYLVRSVSPDVELEVIAPLLAIFLGTRALFGILCLAALVMYKWRRKHLSMDDSLEEFLQRQNNFMPIRYSYSQIRKMSKGFQEKLGEGGYGSVFKGKLRSGQLVAIKILGKSKANGQDFINEVGTIGRIHHVNVVSLVGFCSDGDRRALVYEFMSRGSLDKYIFSREGRITLSWEKIYEVSLGVARGIEYLHRGCDMQILHFDIKPHNVLLDKDLVPKLSDFGLAKLCSTDKSIVSITAARGTIGYIAPELIYKRIGGVSNKADVYSFGMLLMEILGKRKKLDAATGDNSSRTYFPMWVYHEMMDGNIVEVEDTTEEEKSIIKKMTVVALWCIQIRPADRPSMRKAIQMLEGDMERLEPPPEPTFNIDQVPAEDIEESANRTQSSWESTDTSESIRLIVNED